MSVIEQTPLVVVGSYSATVPFNYSLFVAETTLVSNDRLIPQTGPGLPENMKPRIGARVIYRLISDGIHAPALSPLFKKKSSSMGYDYTPGAVNILEFVYDGFDFWYAVASDTTGSAPDFVGDFGLGADELSVRITSSVSAITVDEIASSAAWDFISAIHYVGIAPLTYKIRKLGDLVWNENTNPRLALIEWDCVDLGPQQLEIEVTNGTLTSNVVTTQCVVQDNGSYCS